MMYLGDQAVGINNNSGNYILKVDEITTEPKAQLNYDLGAEYSEVCVWIYGRWITGLTSPYVVVRIYDNNIPATDIGQANIIGETAGFYNNNDRAVYIHTKKLSNGFYESVLAGGLMATQKVSTEAAKFGVSTQGNMPNNIRYISIGTFNSAHMYDTGLKIKIWAKR